MNIPDKFTFFNQNRTLKLTNINGDFYCTLPEVDADTISSAVYDRRNVEHKLASGQWKIVADLTLTEKEPEMKFPFTFECQMAHEVVEYLVTENEDPTQVTLFSKYGTGTNFKSMAQDFIKRGTWRVTSVGEQEPKEDIVEPVPEYGVDIDENGNVLGYGLSEGDYNITIKDGSVKAEKINVGNLSDLTIKITSEGIDEATARMERLAQATENVTMAFESLRSVLDDMGLSFGSTFTYEVTGSDEPFCCNNQ